MVGTYQFKGHRKKNVIITHTVKLINRYIDKNLPLMVKDTCNGPLLPTIYTFFIVLWFSISNASSVISVLRSISTGVNNIRATSKATLPRPTITAVS